MDREHMKHYLKLTVFLPAIILLSACGGGASNNTDSTSIDDRTSIANDKDADIVDEQPLLTSEFKGSIGDGPIIGATVNIYDKNGTLIKTVISDETARYSAKVKAKGNAFPLTMEVIGGIDLVTGRLPDFKMTSVVSHPSAKEVNVNPFTTLIVESANAMPGGLNDENLGKAQNYIEKNMNFGLDPELVSDSITTEIDDTNVGVIVKSSEALGEMIRRASKALISSNSITSADDLIKAIADDMTDGVLDGVGGETADNRVAAVSNIVSAQVLIESLSNTLKVDDADATLKMDDAILTINPQAPTSSLTGQVRINQEQLDQTIITLEASKALVSTSELNTIADTLTTIEAGSLPNEIETKLPSDSSDELNLVIEIASIATDNALAEVTDVLRELVNDADSNIVNTLPQITGDPAKTVFEDSFFEFLPNATDADGDALSFEIQNRPSWMSFNISTGRISGTPSNEDVGFYQNITLTVSDGSDSASIGPFGIEVINVNDAPTILGNPLTNINVGTLYEFQPSTFDVDSDNLAYTIANLPAWADFNTQTGLLSGTPGETNIGEYGNITISVNDGSLTSSLNAFSITVNSNANSNNSLPVISGTPASTIDEDSAYFFQPNASDADNDMLTFSISNKPTWASFNTSNGTLSGTPTINDVGVHNHILISVNDGIGSNSLEAFSITVVEVNSAPSIGGIPATNVNENTLYNFQPVVSDPDDDSLAFSIVNKPSWASFNTTTGELSGTPRNSDVGTTSNIVMTVSDGRESVSLSAFSITVIDAENAPTISGSPATALYENSSYNFTPNANDADDDLLTFSIANKPAWASFDTSTGALTGTPSSSDIGSTSDIVISVTDGFSNPVSLASFSITVESSSATLSWVAPTTNSDDSPLSLSDIGGYKIYTGTNPNNLSLVIDINDSSITEHTITNLEAATHYFSVTAYNQSNVESTRSTVVSKVINSL